MAPPPVHHSTVAPCFHGRPGFLHKHSLLQISSPRPFSLSPCSQQKFSPQVCSPIPTLQLSAHSGHAHQWIHVPVWGTQGHGTDCLCSSHSVPSATDRPFHPPLTASDVSLLSQLISLLVMGFPWMREPLLCFSSPPGLQVPSCFLSSSFSLLPSILPCYAGIFIVLSSVQGLLLVFSWCSVRIVPSVDVFLMHLWREMNSMPSYSSAIFKTQKHSLWKW